MLKNNRGGSRVTTLLYIMVAIIAIYLVVKTVPPYMDYYALDDEVAQQLHLSSINSDEVIINDLASKAHELGLPITRDDVNLAHNEDGTVSIDIKWVATADYGYGFKRDFAFEINANTGKAKE